MSVKKRVKAINRFIAGCKTDGIYDDLNAACIMAGWDSLAGALTPLAGAAPTNSGFLAADFDRGIGLKGDGSSKYLNTNRANNADGQNDKHLAAYVASLATSAAAYRWFVGDDGNSVVGQSLSDKHYGRINDNEISTPGLSPPETGFVGVGREGSTNKILRVGGTGYPSAQTSVEPSSQNSYVFRRNEVNTPGYSNATLAFYSIGSATDLALLDARVSTLMSDLRSIEESDFDADALTYIRAVEEADGAYLETDVKVAINQLVVGLKFDSLWDSIGTSCLLCGPRTIAGALVPLREYGPELWAEQTPTINDADGSAAEWNASTLTMSNTAPTTSIIRPRFDFHVGFEEGKQYRVSGKLSGDLASIRSSAFKLGNTGSNIVFDPITGLFDSTGTVSGVIFPLLITFDGSLGPFSVTIESMSIREVIAAPTAEGGWASGDYSRETGMRGDGSSLYIDTGVANNSDFGGTVEDPQNNKHIAYYATVLGNATRQPMNSGWSANGASQIIRGTTAYSVRINGSYLSDISLGTATLGFIGATRSNASSVTGRNNGTNTTASQASVTPNADNILIFKSQLFSNAGITFYSIGSSIDLAKLDSHITAYVTAIGAAL